MSTKTVTAQDRETAITELRELFPAGATVYTIQRHVSASGSLRKISVMAIDGGGIRNVSHAVGRVLGYSLDARCEFNALRVAGAGMDMSYHLAHDLSLVLHGNGYALSHRSI